MAFEAKKIDPLDLQPRKAIGVKIPFSSKSVFESTFQTKDAIRTNLINYLLTGQGERYFQPTFGTPLRNLLFENLTQNVIEEVKTIIREGIGLFFPKVNVTELQVQPNSDSNAVLVSFKYELQDTNIQDEVVINFEQ